MIGILTFHHVYNHGALLQAFALQHYISSLGKDSVILDVRPFERAIPRIYQNWSPLKLMSLGYIRYRSDLFEKKNVFDSFRVERLSIAGYNEELGSIVSRLGITCVVVGSDQVWNPKYGIAAMSLYTLSSLHAIRKVSYAACVGSEGVKVSMLHEYRRALSEFHQISTRDSFSRDIIVNLTKKTCEVVVDPTLLIDWKNSVLLRDKSAPVTGAYMFVYGFSRQTDSVLSIIKKRFLKPVVGIGMENEYKSDYVDLYAQKFGPEEFVQLIYGSDLVVTKSFHGLMLSISLKKQVIVVSHGLPSISRIRDFAIHCDLEHIIVDQDSVSSLSKFDSEKWIDYEKLKPKLDAWVNRSKFFLSTSL